MHESINNFKAYEHCSFWGIGKNKEGKENIEKKGRIKGQSHEIFGVIFFHKAAPSGPIRVVIGPFLIFSLFGGVIRVCKWLQFYCYESEILSDYWWHTRSCLQSVKISDW